MLATLWDAKQLNIYFNLSFQRQDKQINKGQVISKNRTPIYNLQQPVQEAKPQFQQQPAQNSQYLVNNWYLL